MSNAMGRAGKCPGFPCLVVPKAGTTPSSTWTDAPCWDLGFCLWTNQPWLSCAGSSRGVRHVAHTSPTEHQLPEDPRCSPHSFS